MTLGLKISTLCVQTSFSRALLGKAQHFLSTFIAARSQEVALAGSTFRLGARLTPRGGRTGRRRHRPWHRCSVAVEEVDGLGLYLLRQTEEFLPGVLKVCSSEFGVLQTRGRADVATVSSARWVDSTSVDLQELQDHVGCSWIRFAAPPSPELFPGKAA